QLAALPAGHRVPSHAKRPTQLSLSHVQVLALATKFSGSHAASYRPHYTPRITHWCDMKRRCDPLCNAGRTHVLGKTNRSLLRRCFAVAECEWRSIHHSRPNYLVL